MGTGTGSLAPVELVKAVKNANGMLPLAVYEELYQLAGVVCGGQFVEIGTAHGAATIALALGAKGRTPATTIYTIDRLGGKFSSRSKFGSVLDNEGIVRRNFRDAGVEEMTRLFVGTSDEFAASDSCPDRINLLLIDADGRIDRDLMHFYQRLSPGAPVVIDDVDSSVQLAVNHEGVSYIDLKHRITSLLLDSYENAGFLRVRKRVINTAFCERGERAYDAEEFARLALASYREIVFAEAIGTTWQELALWQSQAPTVREGLKLRALVPNLMFRSGAKILRLLRLR